MSVVAKGNTFMGRPSVGLLFILPTMIVLAMLIAYPLVYTGYLSAVDVHGTLTGKMAAARLAAGAAAPFAFAATMERFGIVASLILSAALGAIGIVAFVAVAMTTKRSLVAAPNPSN